MISAWQVYLVLQLDAIRGFLGFGMLMLGFAAFMIMMGGAIGTECGTDSGYHNNNDKLTQSQKTWLWCKRWTITLAILAALCGLSKALLPSSKTMAAMLILPALTSHEVVDPLAKEAGELYKLAKDALSNAVYDGKPPAPAEQAK